MDDKCQLSAGGSPGAAPRGDTAARPSDHAHRSWPRPQPGQCVWLACGDCAPVRALSHADGTRATAPR